MSDAKLLPEFEENAPLNDESLELLRGEGHHTPSREWDRRFLATIAARDKRIEELGKEIMEQGGKIILQHKQLGEYSELNIENNNLRKRIAELETEVNGWKTKTGKEILDGYTKDFCDQIEELKAEVKRLREALTDITNHYDGCGETPSDCAEMNQIARAALGEKEER